MATIKIKCIKHKASEALFYCRVCGFVCENDLTAEAASKHGLLVINQINKPLCTALYAKGQSDIKLNNLVRIKYTLNKLLNAQINRLQSTINNASHEIQQYSNIIPESDILSIQNFYNGLLQKNAIHPIDSVKVSFLLSKIKYNYSSNTTVYNCIK